MTKLEGYEKTLVRQRRPKTGCIPTGIEWMARHMDVEGVDFDTLQDDFDLAAQGRERNGFENVPAAVTKSYPQVETTPIAFADADRKLDCIRASIARGSPCLVSLWQEGLGYHIVPVVEADSESITVLWMDKATVEAQRKVFDHAEVRRLHDAVPGGKELLVWGGDPMPENEE